jgi:methyl-accepting chemotaxis protein
MTSDSEWHDGMPDRRGAPRTEVQWPARLVFAGRSMECTLRNISETGAAVAVTDAKSVPHRVSLIIAGKPGQRLAEVVWRTSNSLGLKFLTL